MRGQLPYGEKGYAATDQDVAWCRVDRGNHALDREQRVGTNGRILPPRHAGEHRTEYRSAAS